MSNETHIVVAIVQIVCDILYNCENVVDVRWDVRGEVDLQNLIHQRPWACKRILVHVNAK